MRKVFLLILMIFLAGCKTSSPVFFETGARPLYRDADWNLAFYENCAVAPAAIRWVREADRRFLRFTLKDGRVGGCRSDAYARHGAPWWERAEIKQTHSLRANANYRLAFRARFARGFIHERESFLQIHQSAAGCRVGPAAMFRLHRGKLGDALDVRDIRGRWVEVRLAFNVEQARYALHVDGRRITGGGLLIRSSVPCGAPHLKIGIYRPGRKTPGTARTSVLDVDEIRLVEVGR